MNRRRIEYDPTDNSDDTQVLNHISAYRTAVEAEDMANAAGAADRAAHLSERLADQALLDALNAQQSERAIAAAMGSPRSTVQYRITRARARVHGEATDEEDQA